MGVPAGALRLLRLAFAAKPPGSSNGPAEIGANFELDHRRFERDLRGYDRTHLHRARVRALMRMTTGLSTGIKEEIVAQGIVDRARLLQGIAERVDYLRQVGTVVGVARHTRPVLDGRRPGARMPPVKPLARWARRKLGVPAKDARSVGWLIARAIQRRGIRPKDFVSGPFARMSLQAETILAEEYRKAPGVI